MKVVWNQVLAFSGLVIGMSAAVNAGDILGSDAFSTAIGEIDGVDATWTPIGPAGVPINGMAYSATTDTLYGVSAGTRSLYRISRQTGAATVVGTEGGLGFGNVNGLAYDPFNNDLFATDNNTNTLMRVDAATGNTTVIGEIGGGFTEIEGLAYDSDRNVLYGITDLQRRIVSIDLRSAVATAISPVLPDLVWRGLTWDSDNSLLYASAPDIFDDAIIYSFDPVGGRLARRGVTAGVEAVQGLAFVPIPEPATATLILMLGGLFVRRR